MNLYTNNLSRNKRGMTVQCEAIISALKVFPCIHFNQLRYFMPPCFSVHENYGKSISNFLVHEHIACIHDDCLFVKEMISPDENMVDVVWTAIDLYKDDLSNTSTALRTARKGVYPVSATVFKNSLGRYKIITLSSDLDFAKIYAENEAYAKDENTEDLQYIFVMRNTDIIDGFSKAKPIFPFKVAVLEGKFGEYPTIKYYNIEV